MVANQNTGSKTSDVVSAQELGLAKTFFTPLLKEKGGGVKNLEEWISGVNGGMDAIQAGHMLQINGCISTEESDERVAREQAEAVRAGRAIKSVVKEESGKSVKIEKKDNVEWGSDPLDPTTKDFSTLLNEVMAANAKKLESTQLNTEYGMRVGYFVNLKVAVPKDRTDLAKIFETEMGRRFFLVKVYWREGERENGGGEEMWCPLEERSCQQRRLVAWNLLEGTVKSSIPQSQYHHIKIGDIHGLFSFVVGRYGKDREEERRNRVLEKLDKLATSMGEMKNVDDWWGELEAVRSDAKRIGLVVDENIFKSKMKKGISASGNQKLAKSLSEIEYEQQAEKAKARVEGKPHLDWSLDMFVEMLRLKYNTISSSTPHQSYGDNNSSGKGNGNRDRKPKWKRALEEAEKERSKLEKKIFQLKKKNEGGRGGGGSGAGKPAWAGVCVYFQDGKCNKTNCKFEHKKLDGEQLAELKSRVRSKQKDSDRQAGMQCHNCGKKGHRSANCYAPKTNEPQIPTQRMHITHADESKHDNPPAKQITYTQNQSNDMNKMMDAFGEMARAFRGGQ